MSARWLRTTRVSRSSAGRSIDASSAAVARLDVLGDVMIVSLANRLWWRIAFRCDLAGIAAAPSTGAATTGADERPAGRGDRHGVVVRRLRRPALLLRRPRSTRPPHLALDVPCRLGARHRRLADHDA